MSSESVLKALKELNDTPGRNEKEAILKDRLEFDSDFLQTVKWAYDPMRTYGLAKFDNPINGRGTDDLFDPVTGADYRQALDDMAARRLTGNELGEFLTVAFQGMNETSARVFASIILRDLRAGFTAGTVNRVRPGTITTFECMTCKKYEPKKIKKWPMVAETKLDGVRCLTFVDLKGQNIKFFSRKGKEFPAYAHLGPKFLDHANFTWRSVVDGSHIGSAVLSVVFPPQLDGSTISFPEEGFVIDGEMVSGNRNETSGAARRKSEQDLEAVYHVFDIVPMSVFKGAKCPKWMTYKTRRELVELFFLGAPQQITVPPRYIVSSPADVDVLYEKVRARNLEGLIVKNPDSLYEIKRSSEWTKVKAEETVDLLITSYFEGEGKYVGMLGGFSGEGTTDDGVEVHADVGGGFTDAQRKEFWEKRDDMVGKVHIETLFQEVTPDKSLYHPRFVKIRDDKPIREAAE